MSWRGPLCALVAATLLAMTNGLVSGDRYAALSTSSSARGSVTAGRWLSSTATPCPRDDDDGDDGARLRATPARPATPGRPGTPATPRDSRHPAAPPRW